MKIAHLGEKGSFSELAVRGYYGALAPTLACADFAQVFNAVTKGKATAAIIPIENSMAGSIYENYDLLLKHDLHITGEIFLNISHFFIANPGVSLKSIRQVYSHPQVLSQCKNFLHKYPAWQAVSTGSTVDAIVRIQKDKNPHAAAIASLPSSKHYGMSILKRHVEDNPDNTTRFLVLSRTPSVKKTGTSAIKTSIVFSTPNAPGFLYKALSVFALRDINLLKIESRPMMSGKFEYIFYLDISGHHSEKAQQNALTHLQEITTMYRLLGSYAMGKTVKTDV